MSYIAWFSAGVTSAVACKLAIQRYGDVRLFYFETGTAHADNARFIADCERWYGKPIEVRHNGKYQNQFDVFRKTRYLRGPAGARCTLELKKNVRFAIQKELGDWQGQIFGFEFTQKEVNRAIRFMEQYPEAKPVFPLIESKLTKEHCIGLLEAAGIELPFMYQLGYRNNNCVGCVKGGQGYWNKIRTDFPDVFAEMVKVENELGRTCLRSKKQPLPLAKLSPDAGRHESPLEADCSGFCDVEFADVIDPRTAKVLSGEMLVADCG